MSADVKQQLTSASATARGIVYVCGGDVAVAKFMERRSVVLDRCLHGLYDKLTESSEPWWVDVLAEPLPKLEKDNLMTHEMSKAFYEGFEKHRVDINKCAQLLNRLACVQSNVSHFASEDSDIIKTLVAKKDELNKRVASLSEFCSKAEPVYNFLACIGAPEAEQRTAWAAIRSVAVVGKSGSAICRFVTWSDPRRPLLNATQL
jgi:hypothetical protein